MCGRYAAFRPVDEWRRLFATTNPTPNFAPTWNMAPTRHAPVVRRHPATGARHMDLLRWGLVPHWASDPAGTRQPINARCETAATTPMFRDALRQRRCLVPMDVFYEWQTAHGVKHPYAIARADGQTIAAAGLWEGWRGADGSVIRSFAILTTASCPALAPIHARMPVLLEPPDWPLWLGETAGDPTAMLHPTDTHLRIWPIGPAVGNAHTDGPDLLMQSA